MDKINKTLRISMIIIATSLIISVATISYLRLDKPLFITNYIDFEVLDYMDENGEVVKVNNPIVIKYINNRNSEKEVIHIVYKGYEDLNFTASEYKNNNDGFVMYSSYGDLRDVTEIGPYGVYNVYIDLPQSLSLDKWENILLTEATVYFNDGTKEEVDLGKVLLYKDELKEENLDFISGGNYDNDTETIRYRTSEDIEISEIKNLLDIDTDKLFTLEIINPYSDNNEMNIKSGEYFKVNITNKINLDILDKYTVYNFKSHIFYKDLEEKSHSQGIHTFYNEPYFQFNDIVKYLKARGEL